MAISRQTKWVSTSGWRGYVEYVDAVAGANDTGMYDDSPCPSTIRAAEIATAKSVLRKAGIRHRTAWGRSSNYFMGRQMILVDQRDRQRAIELLLPLRDKTQLLWVKRQ